MAKNKAKRILILGYPYFVGRLLELGSKSDFEFLTLPKGFFQKLVVLFRSDLVYQIGGDLKPNRYHRWLFRLGKKLIIHWVGSDILKMKELHNNGFKFCPYLIKKAIHWVEVSWTATELAELGITGKIIPLTPACFPEEVREFPTKFTVLTYLPPGKLDFYGEPQLIDLAKDFPEIVFLVVAASTTDRNLDWPSNLIPVGWVNNMAELYHEVMLLIRLPRHDGLSFMVLEALANGRHVIWNYPFTGVHQTNSYQQTAKALKEIYQAFCEERLTINKVGRDFVERYYNPQIVWEQISKGITEVLCQ